MCVCVCVCVCETGSAVSILLNKTATAASLCQNILAVMSQKFTQSWKPETENAAITSALICRDCGVWNAFHVLYPLQEQWLTGAAEVD
jgi:hypothetical protein